MNWVILVAGGRGARMGLTENKAFAPLLGAPMLGRSLCALAESGAFSGVVVVVGPGERERAGAIVDACAPSIPVRFAQGGEDRQASVYNGLAEVPPDAECIAVHDAARPLVSDAVIWACMASARDYGSGVAAVPLKDTVKRVDAEGLVRDTPLRDELRAVQTPQAFRAGLLRKAHEHALSVGQRATDDAALVEALGVPVRLTQGDNENLKVTTPEDIAIAEAILMWRRRRSSAMSNNDPSIEKAQSAVAELPFRVGQGYDVHRLVEGRELILCGVHVPHERGLLGHSDADVAAHALSDALLGAAGLGDIGRHFPDTDLAYAGADSLRLLAEVVRKVAALGYAVGNVDVTIVAQRPKLAPHIPAMQDNLARVLGIPHKAINVKATTTEQLGFEGEGAGMSAQAAALIVRSGS